MNLLLTAEEIRVLGCLVEKEVTTPDYYPMTLNALVNACNQKSCRDPMVKYDDALVEQILESLRQKQLTCIYSGSESRTPKHKQRLTELFFFTPAERAILCELLLRGAQTPGELRNRAERMNAFKDLSEVEATLKELEIRPDGPWVVVLPRQPGRKEARYAQLMDGIPETRDETSQPSPAAPRAASEDQQRLDRLESEVLTLREELKQLKHQLGPLLGQTTDVEPDPQTGPA
ncbi:MAG: YceH family protein [Lentisphaerota bacterium]